MIRKLADYAIDRKAVVDDETLEAARKIVEDVRANGDKAVRKYAKKFDREDFAEVTEEASIPQQVQVNLRAAYESITRYHKNGVLKPFEIEPLKGVRLGMAVVPYERAGLYVPGGLATYPSSLIMAATPAIVAGVKELILCTPDPSPVLLFTAKLVGISKIFKVGGAHAIAAMAYGTESVPACEILVGPGNRYVTAAKKIVSNDVAIDFLAGPTEILVLSDGDANPKFIAADMIAQAEHDPAACAILVTTSEKQAAAVEDELAKQAPQHERAEIIQKSLKDHGAILLAPDLEAAIAFTNRFAPEHLVIAAKNPNVILKSIRHAGSVFLGDYSPVAVGDYCAGPNAILPTLGDARRRSGLSANTFVKTVAWQMLSPEGLALMTPTAVNLAKVENLGAHRRSIEIRHERG